MKTIEMKKTASVNEAIEIINRLNYRNNTFEYHGYTREDNADIKYRHFDGYKANGEPDGFSLIEIVVDGKLEVVRFFNHFRNITVDIKLGDFNPDYSRYDEVIDADAKIENIDSKVEVEINAVASYTLSAMCEEDAIRHEEEIEEVRELKEIVKQIKGQKVKGAKKMTETERQQKWLEDAKIDENGKMHVYILYEEFGNDCMAYLINNKGKKTRIKSKFAYQLLDEGKAIKVNKAA